MSFNSIFAICGFNFIFCVEKDYSTVTDLMISTTNRKFIPYLKFVCVIIYCKGSIVSTKYKDFDIVFVEKC